MRLPSTYDSFWRTHKLHIAVAGLVVLMHAGLIYALWLARADHLPATEPVFAEVIVDKPLASAPVTATKAATVARRSSSKTSVPEKQPATQNSLIVTVPQLAAVSPPAERTAPALAGHPANGEITGSPQAASLSTVSADLSLACPVRTAPVYPRSARKLGETGKVSLRVELDETGRLVSSDVAQSSGYSRLDEAALAAVKSWRCQPAMRDGQALRIVSIESFEFNLND